MSEVEQGYWLRDADLFSAYDRLRRAGLVKGAVLFTAWPLGDAGPARTRRSGEI